MPSIGPTWDPTSLSTLFFKTSRIHWTGPDIGDTQSIPYIPPTTPENMPYFQGPRLPAMPPPPTTNDIGDASVNYYSAYTAHASASSGEPILGLQHLSNVLICFVSLPALLVSHTTYARLLHNSEIMLTATILPKFDWTIYGFNSSHFACTIQAHGMPFNIALAWNPFANGRASFKEVCMCLIILSNAPALFDHI